MAKTEEAAKPAGKMKRVFVRGERTFAGSLGVFTSDGEGWCELPEKLAKGLIESGQAFEKEPKD